MRAARSILPLTLVALSAALVACNDDGRTLRPARLDQNGSVYTTTTSSILAPASEDALGEVADRASLDPALTAPALAFVLNLPWADGGVIDDRYTCVGDDIQPGVSWLGAPAEAVEMAIVVTDTDAGDIIHWAIAGLDPSDPFIGEGSTPAGAVQTANDVDQAVGWAGPCPPTGSSHHYQFSLYALGQQLELSPGASAQEMLAAIDLVALSVTHRTGVYPGI